jgi:hypothetical protein
MSNQVAILFGANLMKITYLTWGETPRSYGVFGSQVIGQIKATRNFSSEVNIELVSGVPIIHSGFVREKWGYFKQISNIENIFARLYYEINQTFLRIYRLEIDYSRENTSDIRLFFIKNLNII